MSNPESPVQLQSDNVTNAGQVRAITAYVVVGGVLTPVQMQVIVPADATGAALEEWSALTDPMREVLAELREMRIVLCKLAEVLPPNSLTAINGPF